MAKRKKRYGKKKKSRGHRKNPKRVAAAKRAYRKMKREGRGIAAGHRRGGKKRKGYSKKKSRGGKRAGGLSTKGHQVYQALINRGRTPQQAHKVASRLDRMRTGKVKRYFEREAQHAKSAQQLSNLFAGIGSAGHLAAMQR